IGLCADSSELGACPSLVPSQAVGTAGHTSKPLTLSPALGSAGSLQRGAEGRPPEGRAPEQWDTAASLGGPPLQGAALVSLLVLAPAGVLVGLSWCCCSSSWRARRAGALGLCPSCAVCYTRLGQVAPGGLQMSRPALQGQGGHP
uniref:Uncharacterized protein n=1 Tax=Suricata suricatta TaxID=37032 RepID=A0A673TVL9_SURSU